ncbi:MAG: OB-fold nucleic acid binding domain-containing protein [Candidatus Roseilinea sp.]|uniref:OB-fold nucleic acid binding domain-containing protein n=1 Tax=Candidatus Roseilinea sp. TaxID=2838777 RepID=UPI00404B71A5
MNLRNLTLSFVSVLLVLPLLLPGAHAASAQPPPVVPLGDITPADEGTTLTIEGAVVGTENFASGFKLHINDGSGQVIVLIWADDWDHIYDSYRINVGAVVRVTGKVDVYRGQIEIVPKSGSDVKVVKWAKRNWRKYALGSMNGNDHNAVVWVEGWIADITPARDGAYMLIYDETGAQKVHLYDVVARRIPRREQLWIGQRVSVVGRVRARRRVGIEIVPALPHDVYVVAGDAGSGARGESK